MMIHILATARRIALLAALALLASGCTNRTDSAPTGQLAPADASRGDSPATSAPPLTTIDSRAEPPAGPRPKAVVPETQFDFGNVGVGYLGEHEFVIRNEGDAPLTLEKGGTSCTCTLSHLREGSIPPGGAASVILEWSLVNNPGPFRQTATIRTNDPARPEIHLVLIGVGQAEFAHEPAAIQFIDSPQGLPATTDGFVYSQTWSELEVVGVESSLPGLSWNVQPFDANLLDAYRATSGARISFTASSELTAAAFEGHVVVRVRRPNDEAEPRTVTWRVAGGPVGGIWLSGSKFDEERALIGPVSYQNGGKIALSMKAKDLSRELVVEKIETTPSFLVARAVPIRPQGKYVGLFRIELEVPPGSPPCNYMAPNQAEVRITTNNPGKPELKFKVEFAVIDE